MDVIQLLWTAIVTGNILPDLGYGSYVLIAILVALEGPGVTLAAAAMAGSGVLNPWLVLMAAGLGNFGSDAGWYMLGYLGHFELLKKHVPAVKKFATQIACLEQNIYDQAVKLLLVTKLSLGIAVIPTLVAVGMARVPWPKLLPVSLISELIWTGGLVLAGFFLGDFLTRLELGLRIMVIGGGIVLLLVLPLMLTQMRQSRKKGTRRPLTNAPDIHPAQAASNEIKQNFVWRRGYSLPSSPQKLQKPIME
jgi:membrane protein DedA with SNARE-associated domain